MKIKIKLGDTTQAVKSLEAYKQDIRRKTQMLVQRLTDTGVEVAKAKLLSMGANYTGETANSIVGYYNAGLNAGIIRAGAAAMWCEFGTGVVGQSSPHPTMPWQYDTNNHGDSGWFYFDEAGQRFRWTKGMPSRPFMYETAKELEKIAPALAKEVFSS